MTRTVLVTGVGGFLGSHVVESLLSRTDWRVVGVDSFRHNGDFMNVVDAAGHDRDRVTAVVHDLTVPFGARHMREFAESSVDYVVNIASRSHVDESIADPTEFVSNNVHVMLTVLELCRKLSTRRLIHVSTDEVHGPFEPASVHEHRPSSPYAASKAAQVDLVKAWARTYSIPSTVVTSANMFGERQSPSAYVPIVVRALLDGAPVSVHYHDGQPGERSYTYVRNVADRLVDELLAENAPLDAPPLPSPEQTIHHVRLPGQRRINNHALARMVADIAELPLTVKPVEAGRHRPGYDPSYAPLIGTWTPPIDFDEGLRRTVRWALGQYGSRR